MAVYVKAFYDWVEQTAALTDAERGRLFVAMLEYARSGEVPALEGNERILFPVFKAQIDREEAAASVKAQSGAKGGKGKQTEAQASKSKQTDFLQANTPNKEEEKEEDNEKEKEEEYEYEKEKECVKEKGALPLYPLRGRHTPSLFIFSFPLDKKLLPLQRLFHLPQLLFLQGGQHVGAVCLMAFRENMSRRAQHLHGFVPVIGNDNLHLATVGTEHLLYFVQKLR